METVKIRKGNIYNVVPAGAYESLYKPNGWVKVRDEPAESELTRELSDKCIRDENRQNAYIRAKAERQKRHFDDGLFKEEGNNDV